MKGRLLATAALGTVLVAASTPAYADGIYLGLFGGVNHLEDADGEISAYGYDLDIEVQNDTGWALGTAVGYAFDFGLRGDVELAYRSNQVDEISGYDPEVDVDLNALSVMGNLWYDLPLGAFKPFVGGGVGMARVTVDVDDLGDESDWTFAYQLGGGLAYQITHNIDLVGEYRYFVADDPSVQDQGVEIETEYNSHSILIGLRGYM